MKAFLVASLATALLTTAGVAQDTLVVRADNPPSWGAQPRLVEELRIGALEGDPHYTFGEISGVAIGEGGEVWIADDRAHVIRRFGPDGRYLGDVGHDGQGPGEFVRVRGLQTLGDGRVAAWDPQQKRINIFAKGGNYLSSMSVSAACGTYSTLPSFVVGPDGSFFILTCVLTLPPRELSRPGASAAAVRSGIQYVWMHIASTGMVIDTLRMPPDDLDLGGRNYPFGWMSPYTARTVSILSPLGYLLTTRTDQYAIHRPLRDGRTVRIERSWSSVSVQREEKAMFEGLRDLARRRLIARRQEPDLPAPPIPDKKPPLWAFQVDRDGRIWAALHQEGYHRPETEQELAFRTNPPDGVPGAKAEWWEPLVTDVIEPSGRFLGAVRFPNPRTTIAWSSGNTVWVVELGEFDEGYVVRYRLEHS